MRLSGAQQWMLEAAETAPSLGWDGVSARRQGVRTAEALARAGFLRFAGWGMDMDDGGEARVYEITDAGREALIANRGAPPSPVTDGRTTP